MAYRLVVVMLYFDQYRRDGGAGMRVGVANADELMLYMPEYHAFDCHRRNDNRLTAHQARRYSEQIPPIPHR